MIVSAYSVIGLKSGCGAYRESYGGDAVDRALDAGAQSAGVEGGHGAVGTVVDAGDHQVGQTSLGPAFVDAYLDAVHRGAVEGVFPVAGLVLYLLEVEFGVEGKSGGLAGLGVEGGDDSHVAVAAHDGGQDVDTVGSYAVVVGYEDLSGVGCHILMQICIFAADFKILQQ